MDIRFWAKVRKTETCWLWTGALRNGYGHLSRNGRSLIAHRYAYEMLAGPIPDGLDLDHLCRVRACCNPSHLDPVTRRENLRRGIGNLQPPSHGAEWQRAKTHCPKGHPYDEENTYIRSNGTRLCRECKRESNRRENARRPKRALPPGERTHCPAGHPYDSSNTVILRSGARRCRECQRLRSRARRRNRSARKS